uniref:Mucin 5AC, oligomeric mucus/gel-forming n=1 Tax=Mustela putorius furo TaxID=9669 RepID=M3Y4X2_MUSPF
RGMSFLPPLRTAPVVRARNPAHNGRVCSTWGDFHYKTFDGDIFRFPGRCNYVLSAHCGAVYEDFNVQLRRGGESNATTVTAVTMKLDGMVIQLTKGSILVNGRPTQPPFSQSGVLIEVSNGYLKVDAKLGLILMWSPDDSLLLELDPKFANQTCGLCGDFNGQPVFNEFLSHGVKLTALEYGNLQKMDGPTEQCQDPVPVPPTDCGHGTGPCEEILTGQLFSGCRALLDAGSYVQACRLDLCLCEHADRTRCICPTLAEYARQCAHAGGLPPDWRSPHLCPQTCPPSMQHRECGSPCADTCSNPEHSQLCEDHCVDGCFCPEGTVLDDIGQTGCIPASQCPCVYNGATYAPGTSYATDCTNCTCSRGQWSCRELPCPGTCAVLGGAHISTFDERQYTVHGDCSYVLAKPCDSSVFTVLGELRRCGLTDTETCLKSLTLSLDGGHTVVTVKASGEVFVNQIYTQMPVSAANVTLFRPSTFFIVAQTKLGLQLTIQLVPVMQVFVRLGPELRGLTCGLCGNFNQNQADDFRTLSGVVEGTAAAFANTWKTQASCPNVKNSFEDPCSLSVENERYAQRWCSRLTDPRGPFAQCHVAVNPGTFYSNCMFDTCNCEKSEDCLCAALSSYVHACASKGVLLRGWRDGVCAKPMATCPKSLTYQYSISTCQPTCRARSHEDITCGISFVPVDGCTCPNGTFLDEAGKCVPATSCPCYHEGSVVPNGESLHERGVICTCTQGTLTCIGGQVPTPVCTPPMVFLDCRNATPGASGAGCQKSCFTLDMDCYSPQCEPGCVCPDGLVADGEGRCVAPTDCPCVHNEASYLPGQTIRVGCNTCTCENRKWRCTEEPCLATCAVYGDGHYVTFDGRRYSFSGDCGYTLLQDHCRGNDTTGTFRVVSENVPCGTTGVTCSKAIKLFLGSFELRLSEGRVEVLERGVGQEPPYSIRQMGIYLVVDTEAGLVLLWDRKTSIFLKLSPEFKGRVCGLCGNFDDKAINDFTTRGQSVVGSALEFGNSWKFSPACPDAPAPRDPCTANPYRKSWAQKQCSIINSATFAACHAHVEPTKYYEACVGDACACDSGGDCECFCTAVAAYAQACHDVGVCVSWRTPDTCPLFCDYYNPEGQCEWHYQPCGAPCMRTCRNPGGRCLHDLPGLEGCYPKCPPAAPIFDEDQMQCVATCPTPPPPLPCRVRGKSYRPGTVVPSDQNCHSCICTENGVQCAYDSEACVCIYDGRHFRPGDVIYHTTDGTGGCLSARCSANGTIERGVSPCSATSPAPPTTFSFSTSAPGTTPGTTVQPHQACGEECQWSPWLDISRPGRGTDSGDFDTLENLRAHGYQVCAAPKKVECQAEEAPGVPLQVLGQHVECSPTVGLTCYNHKQTSGLCHNYQIRILCCFPRTCSPSSSPAQTTPPAASGNTETGPTREVSGVSSVPTEHKISPATVAATGTSILSTTSETPAPGATVPVQAPGTTTTPPGTPTPAPGTTTAPPGTPTPALEKTTLLTLTPMPISTTHEPCLKQLCTWTHWIDSSYPEPGINSGDFDTFPNLRAKGYKFCAKPNNVECRAEFFPNVPLEELGQDLICDKNVGLLCLNKNQLPPICYNYAIRIECCEQVDVCTSTPHAGSSEVTHPIPRDTETQTQLTRNTGVPSSPTQHGIASSAPVKPAASTTPNTYRVSSPVTVTCQPQCTWTKWFDVDFPSPGPHGGDVESFSNIMRRGEKICHRPEYISRLECRAESHPEVSIEKLGQVVQCDLSKGLVCRNRDQAGNVGMCLNYEVRVLCCEPPEHCTTHKTVTVPHTPSMSPTNLTETTVHLVTSHSTSVPTSSLTKVPETSSTPVPTTSPRSVPETSSTSVSTTSPTSVPETSSTSVPTTSPTSVPETSSTTVPASSPTSVPTTSSTTVSWTSPTSVPPTGTTSAPTASTTPVHTHEATHSPPVTVTCQPRCTWTKCEATHSPPVTVTCQPRCTWTKWFDVDFPSPGPHGGDVESFSNIMRRGEKICRRPEYISRLECRAESHPEVSIEKLGQVVQCDLSKGLVCRNRDQGGNVGMCLNYEVRVLCCELPEHCGHTSVTPSSAPPEHTSVVSSVPWPSSTAPASTTCFCSVSASPSGPTPGPPGWPSPSLEGTGQASPSAVPTGPYRMPAPSRPFSRSLVTAGAPGLVGYKQTSPNNHAPVLLGTPRNSTSHNTGRAGPQGGTTHSTVSTNNGPGTPRTTGASAAPGATSTTRPLTATSSASPAGATTSCPRTAVPRTRTSTCSCAAAWPAPGPPSPTLSSRPRGWCWRPPTAPSSSTGGGEPGAGCGGAGTLGVARDVRGVGVSLPALGAGEAGGGRLPPHPARPGLCGVQQAGGPDCVCGRLYPGPVPVPLLPVCHLRRVLSPVRPCGGAAPGLEGPRPLPSAPPACGTRSAARPAPTPALTPSAPSSARTTVWTAASAPQAGSPGPTPWLPRVGPTSPPTTRGSTTCTGTAATSCPRCGSGHPDPGQRRGVRELHLHPAARVCRTPAPSAWRTVLPPSYLGCVWELELPSPLALGWVGLGDPTSGRVSCVAGRLSCLGAAEQRSSGTAGGYAATSPAWAPAWPMGTVTSSPSTGSAMASRGPVSTRWSSRAHPDPARRRTTVGATARPTGPSASSPRTSPAGPRALPARRPSSSSWRAASAGCAGTSTTTPSTTSPRAASPWWAAPWSSATAGSSPRPAPTPRPPATPAPPTRTASPGPRSSAASSTARPSPPATLSRASRAPGTGGSPPRLRPEVLPVTFSRTRLPAHKGLSPHPEDTSRVMTAVGRAVSTRASAQPAASGAHTASQVRPRGGPGDGAGAEGCEGPRPRPTGSVPTVTTVCVREFCLWSDWYDSGPPEPGMAGGDFETFVNLRQKGYEVCLAPVSVECRARRLPDTPLLQLGQKVECDVAWGLTCFNSEQSPPLCHDYELRVLCCSYLPCGSSPGATTTALGTTTSPGATTTALGTTTSPRAASWQPLARSTPATETPPAETTVTGTWASSSSPALATTSCQPRSTPSLRRPGGTLSRTTRSGAQEGPFASSLWTSSARPRTSPAGALRSWASACTATSILACQDQCAGPTPGAQTLATAQTTGGPSRETPQTHTTGTVPAGPPSSPRTEPRTTAARMSPGTLGTATTAATPSQSTAGCQPQCEWTDWFDVDFPTSGVEGGDLETLDNIRAAGGTLCEEPQKIECRAENYPEVSIDQIGQVLSCDLHTGLVCKNQDQKGPFNMCFNYNIRVLCCRPSPHCPSTPAPGGSTSLGQGVPVSTTQTLPSPARTPERVSSPGPYASPGTPTTTTTKPTSPRAPTTAPEVTSRPWTSPGSPPSTATAPEPTTPSRGTPVPEITSSPPGTTVGLSTAASRATVPTGKTETSPPVTSSHTQTPTSPMAKSTACEPRCAWTDWLDESYPAPGASGGDFETYANLRAMGKAICQQPRALQCRAEAQPETPLEELGQVVRCGLEDGLVCRNQDQAGPFHMCLNYQVRVLCCEGDGHCTSTLATTALSSRGAGLGPTPVLPTSTMVPSPPAPSTGRTTNTATCRPTCRWTDWLDSDQPRAGRYGGDIETYYHIRDAGGQLCAEPEAIECQAVLYPDVPWEQLGQDVRCDVNYGLICRNNWQTGGRTCLNYRVRVLCCDGPGHCATQPSTEPAAASSSSTRPTSSGVTRLQTTATLPSSLKTTTTHPNSPETTQRYTVSTTQISPASHRTTQMGPSSAGTTQGGPVSTTQISPASSRTMTVSTSPMSVLTTPGPPVSSRGNLTTRCFCRALGQLFSPGDIVYNKTDGAGCSFYAVCSQHCDIDRFQDACPTSPPPEASSTPAASPSQPQGCDLLIPPRQVNESWTLPDCTVARCEGHNHVVLLGRKPVASIHCVNGHPPVRVSQDNEPCDFHFECECSCSGWGGSHYTTFDGTTYSFADNCTHVLMKEIRPRYGNLSISMNGYYCGAAAAAAPCPRALSVHYKSMEVILTTHTGAHGQEQSLILFDQTQVGSGFSKNGVSVSVAGATAMTIDIAAAGVSVTFDGQVFHIQLSYSRFSHNTEGQCGTCTNSRTDDCRRPDGTMAATCQDMAHHWLVPESGREGCLAPTRPPSTAGTSPSAPTTPASSPCPPAPLCELLQSPLFAECHALIPPDPFVSSCVSDGCQADDPRAPCRSLEAYAALCRARGVCSDWRNATNGLCDVTCPPDKVYRPCGPAQPASCDSRSPSGGGKGLAEGCFCPDGLTLFNTHTDVCVRACACVGPDGFPKSPGERWVSNCQACLCHEGSMSVRCAPVPCEPQERPPQCGRAGFVTETRPLANNSCCLETLCVCNTTTCPQSPPRCRPGEELIRTQKEGDCCPTFICRPLLCYYNQTAFGIGATFPSLTPCHTCTCLPGDSQGPTVRCEEDTCNTTCSPGSEYRKVDGQCCGECVQTACPTEDGQLVQPSETWVNSLVDNCTEYRCQVRNGLHVLITRATPCANMSSCQGILRKTGCCFSCEEVVRPDQCQVHVNRTILTHQGCATQAPVNVTFCGGSCPGLSKYSTEAQAMERQCTCCRETEAHEEVVTLRCPDGTAVRRTYTHVDKCSCAPACVHSPKVPEDSTPILLT